MAEDQTIDKWDGLTKEQEAQAWASMEAHQRTIFWQFVRLLLWGDYTNGKGEKNALEVEEGFWKSLYWRIGCLSAMLLRRHYSIKDKSYEYFTIGWANNYNNGYEWGCDTISYNPKTFRYTVGTDGECLY